MGIICVPDAQEATAVPSDSGGPVSEIEARFSSTALDYSNMSPLLYEKTGRDAVSTEAFQERDGHCAGGCLNERRWRLR